MGCCASKPGRIMFEMSGVREEVAAGSDAFGPHELPVAVKFVIREDRIRVVRRNEAGCISRNSPTRNCGRKRADLKEELFNLRFQAATGQLDNAMRIRQVRKDIARVMTILRERELGLKRA